MSLNGILDEFKINIKNKARTGDFYLHFSVDDILYECQVKDLIDVEKEDKELILTFKDKTIRIHKSRLGGGGSSSSPYGGTRPFSEIQEKQKTEITGSLAERLNAESADPDDMECAARPHPEGAKRGGYVPVVEEEDESAYYDVTSCEWFDY